MAFKYRTMQSFVKNTKTLCWTGKVCRSSKAFYVTFRFRHWPSGQSHSSISLSKFRNFFLGRSKMKLGTEGVEIGHGKAV